MLLLFVLKVGGGFVLIINAHHYYEVNKLGNCSFTWAEEQQQGESNKIWEKTSRCSSSSINGRPCIISCVSPADERMSSRWQDNTTQILHLMVKAWNVVHMYNVKSYQCIMTRVCGILHYFTYSRAQITRLLLDCHRKISTSGTDLLIPDGLQYLLKTCSALSTLCHLKKIHSGPP